MSHFEWENIDVNAGNMVHGIISNIDADADTCDVELDVVESSQQGLVVVPFDRNLLNIPIEYPDCNSGAFGDGDFDGGGGGGYVR